MGGLRRTLDNRERGCDSSPGPLAAFFRRADIGPRPAPANLVPKNLFLCNAQSNQAVWWVLDVLEEQSQHVAVGDLFGPFEVGRT